MRRYIWLWKHRHCWEQLKYLYEQRGELKRILRSIYINADAPSEFQADENDPQIIDAILDTLREFDRIPMPNRIPARPQPILHQLPYEWETNARTDSIPAGQAGLQDPMKGEH